MGRKNNREIVLLNKWNEFSDKVCDIIREKLDIQSSYYRVYCIYKIDNKNEYIIKPFTEEIYNEHKQKLNSTFLDRFIKSIENKKAKQEQKKSSELKMIDELFGAIDNEKMDYSDDNSIESMKKLADTVINIKSKDLTNKLQGI